MGARVYNVGGFVDAEIWECDGDSIECVAYAKVLCRWRKHTPFTWLTAAAR